MKYGGAAPQRAWAWWWRTPTRAFA